MKTKTCHGCEVKMELSEFNGPWKGGEYDSRCKPCRKSVNREYYLRMKDTEKNTPNTKVCSSCENLMTYKRFGTHPGTPTGLQASCKKCKSEMARLAVFRNQHDREFVIPKKKKCSRCKKVKSGSEFFRQSGRTTGLGYSCKKCLAKSEYGRYDVREVTVTEKWCPGCEDMLPADEFYKNCRAKSGLWTYCKPCEGDRKKEARGTL